MEFFAARKADISIVEMMDQIGRDLDPVTKNDTKCMMKSHDVHQLTKTALLEVKADSFLVKGSEGEYELPFDYGFVCLGMRAKGQLYSQLLEASQMTMWKSSTSVTAREPAVSLTEPWKEEISCTI